MIESKNCKMGIGEKRLSEKMLEEEKKGEMKKEEENKKEECEVEEVKNMKDIILKGSKEIA